jgi:hypothetical protein
MTFTPGPWHLEEPMDDDGGLYRQVRAQHSGLGWLRLIGDVVTDDAGGEANANLIPAAPEMIDYIRLHASSDPEAARILAKAEGREPQ